MVKPVSGLFILLLLGSLACSMAKVASPPALPPSTAERLPTGVPAASEPEPVPPPASITPASPPRVTSALPASPAPAPDVVPVPGPNEVWIWDNEYRPDILTVPVGTTVVWTSYDVPHQHDVDCPGLFFASLAFGGSFNYTFTERGIFRYRDLFADMKGTIIVE